MDPEIIKEYIRVHVRAAVARKLPPEAWAGLPVRTVSVASDVVATIAALVRRLADTHRKRLAAHPAPALVDEITDWMTDVAAMGVTLAPLSVDAQLTRYLDGYPIRAVQSVTRGFLAVLVNQVACRVAARQKWGMFSLVMLKEIAFVSALSERPGAYLFATTMCVPRAAPVGTVAMTALASAIQQLTHGTGSAQPAVPAGPAPATVPPDPPAVSDLLIATMVAEMSAPVSIPVSAPVSIPVSAPVSIPVSALPLTPPGGTMSKLPGTDLDSMIARLNAHVIDVRI